MMSKHAEYVIIHFIYMQSQEKHLMMTRRRNRPSGTVSQVSDWYIRTLNKERSALEPGTHIRYKEWRIFSGSEDLFTVNEIRFDQFYIFLGVEAIHWVFFKKDAEQTRLEGSAVLSCSHCGCCIFSQYPRIVDTVKTYITCQEFK